MVDLFAMKEAMMRERRGTPSGVPCDKCGKTCQPELHHIIARRYTKPKGAARAATEVPELMILLCRECHSWADTGGARAADKCLRLNMARYGLNPVKTALSNVLDVAPWIRISLPEEKL